MEKMSPELGEGDCLAWAAKDPSGVLSPYRFSRRKVGREDVLIKITHCGICSADVGWTRNYRGDVKYPVIPGHEIVGYVKEVGSDVSKFKVGDRAGVGTYVNSCQECEFCKDKLESDCEKGVTLTFGGLDVDGTVTKGGYSSFIVVNQSYCYTIPENMPSAVAAPLLCAGITVYSPMMRHKMNQPGKSLGVIGLGGLGHMAVKFGKAFGLRVTVFSTSVSKKNEAISLLGVDDFVVSSDEERMKEMAGSLDFVILTASGNHQFNPYLSLLKKRGVFIVVGFSKEIKFSPVNLIIGSKTLSGSLTGGTEITQQMIDFCAVHKIYPEIELIPIDYCNEAIERLIKRDVKYRFVIEVENSLK